MHTGDVIHCHNTVFILQLFSIGGASEPTHAAKARKKNTSWQCGCKQCMIFVGLQENSIKHLEDEMNSFCLCG